MRHRPTVAEARIKRHMRQAARRAKVATRKTAHAEHRGSLHTAAGHLRQMGADDATATGMASSIRKRLSGGIKGFALRDGVRRACTRYTRGQVIAALTAYKPRKDAYKAFRDLALAA
ncbi:hypothetical protein NGM33_28715 [Nocardiopsis dassonvillei]|uniref:hypothetical protein n=1 Tax=Nocardiopsis dassonvillei TaxID=2014 RepID=UPI0020A440D1|nr:hypothetical protein [Nocardiopsis dassonvillei]MCP3017320.1 hypothetical protein [Nocardiopsis dassonvillei]